MTQPLRGLVNIKLFVGSAPILDSKREKERKRAVEVKSDDSDFACACSRYGLKKKPTNVCLEMCLSSLAHPPNTTALNAPVCRGLNTCVFIYINSLFFVFQKRMG